MQQNTQGGGLNERNLQNAAAENEDAFSAPGAEATQDDTQFSDEHPLASPGELAGTADQAIAAEIAALGPGDGSLSDAADEQLGEGTGSTTMGDAIGSSAGMDIGSGTRSDTSGAGGGEPLDQQASPGISGSRSPGGDNRG